MYLLIENLRSSVFCYYWEVFIDSCHFVDFIVFVFLVFLCLASNTSSFFTVTSWIDFFFSQSIPSNIVCRTALMVMNPLTRFYHSFLSTSIIKTVLPERIFWVDICGPSEWYIQVLWAFKVSIKRSSIILISLLYMWLGFAVLQISMFFFCSIQS